MHLMAFGQSLIVFLEQEAGGKPGMIWNKVNLNRCSSGGEENVRTEEVTAKEVVEFVKGLSREVAAAVNCMLS